MDEEMNPPLEPFAPLPNERVYFRAREIAMTVRRTLGGIRFALTNRGDVTVTHTLSLGEAATLGDDLMHPERFGPVVPDND